MPNGVKYSTTTPTGSLRKSNVALGIIGDLGPTSTTNFYSDVPPISGKYVINKTSVSGIPNFYAPADDAELTRFARQEGATGANTGSTAAILSWIATQPNLMAVNFDYENIVTDGLLLNVDAGFVASYPTTGTTWYDLSGASAGGNGTLTNGPTFNTAFSGGVVFDGTNDYVNFGNILTTQTTTQTLSFVITVSQPQLLSSGFYIGTVFGRFGTNDFFRDYTIGIFNTGNVANPATYDIYFQTLNQAGSTATTFTLGTYAFSSTPRSFTFSENAGVCSGYTNGTYVNQASITHYTPPASVEVDMGFTNNSTKYLYFRGIVNQLQYYNVALTGAQVLANFNAIKGRYGL